MKNFSSRLSISFNHLRPLSMIIVMLFACSVFSDASELPNNDIVNEMVEFVKKKEFKSVPEVTVLEPTNRRDYFTFQRKEIIQVYVKDVDSKKDISISVNGKEKRSFKYKKRQNMVYTKVKLDKGSNFIDIHAQNSVGHSSETIRVFRRKNK